MKDSTAPKQPKLRSFNQTEYGVGSVTYMYVHPGFRAAALRPHNQNTETNNQACLPSSVDRWVVATPVVVVVVIVADPDRNKLNRWAAACVAKW